KMLEIAKQNINEEGLDGSINIIKMPIVEIDKKFSDKSFDKVTAILSFSEFYIKEQDYALDQIFRILKDNGEFILVDEVKPKKLRKKILYFIVRIPIAFINFVKVHVSTKPLRNFEDRLKKHNFQIIEEKLYLLDTLKLMRIKKYMNLGIK
ncbi:MAG: class I SAM-dependent methyltransferase, partial [Promethearchaeota archaeon]